MKKTYICIIAIATMLVLLSALGGIILWSDWKKNHDERKRAYLEYKYERQSVAFTIGLETSYKDFSYVSVNSLIILLAAYKNTDGKIELTIEDIEEYLSSEYDEKGRVKALYPPREIDDYIDWYWSGGDEIYREYLLGLTRYNMDHEDIYGNDEFSDMDEGLLNKMIEEFNSCPDKDVYMDLEKWIEKQDAT